MTRRRFGYVRQLASGRWQASYVGPDKLRYRAPHTFPTEKLAEKWVRYEEGLIETNQWALARSKATPLFGEYCTEFIDTQTNDCETLSNEISALNQELAARISAIQPIAREPRGRMSN